MRTLAEWSRDWPYSVRPWQRDPETGRAKHPSDVNAATATVHVTPDGIDPEHYPGLRAEAWHLSDAIVSSVSGGSIWFSTDPDRVARSRAVR